jgi:hypothetical protein
MALLLLSRMAPVDPRFGPHDRHPPVFFANQFSCPFVQNKVKRYIRFGHFAHCRVGREGPFAEGIDAGSCSVQFALFELRFSQQQVGFAPRRIRIKSLTMA